MRTYTQILRLILIAVLVGLTMPVCAPGRASAPPLPATPTTNGYAPGELLVRFREDVISAQASDTVLGRYQAAAVETLYASPVQRVSVPEGKELSTAAALAADPRVLYAEPNYIYHAFGAPNDPEYSKQWGHNADRINSAAAWDITTGSTSITIAIIDTGIDAGHPDLAGKIVAGYDFVAGDSDPRDENGHGTHVAGIAAANTNNGVGVAGMSWGARIMPVRVLDSSGSGYTADILSGINWAVAHGAKVLNLSLGGTGGTQAMQDAINAAHNAGVLVVAAMGNSRTKGNPVNYPAAYANVMAVAATGQGDVYAPYSQYGSHCDISAPGGNMSFYQDSRGIYSTLPTYDVYMTTHESFHKNYDYVHGTSQASPYVAGLAALIWSVAPSLTPDQVQMTIQNMADDLGPAGWDQDYGWGRIDAARTLQALVPGTPALALISNPENDGNYTVGWNAVSGATSYTLEEDDNGSFSSPITRYSGSNVNFNVTGQAPGVWYYRVRAANAYTSSAWSVTRSTNVALGTPALNPISNPTQADMYLLDWNDVSYATNYRLEQATNAAFTSPVVRYIGSASQYQVTGQPGGVFYYRVQAIRDATSSNQSNVVSTTVKAAVLAAPALYAIANVDEDGNYTVGWSAVTSATAYYLEESSSGYFSAPVMVYSGSNTTLTVTDHPGGTWYYRVRALSAGGNSPWSAGQSARVTSYVYLPLVMKNYTPPVPMLLLNGNFEQGRASWSETSSTGYALIINETELAVTPHGGSWAAWLGGADNETSVLSQQFSVPASQPYLGYWYWIGSYDSCGGDYAQTLINTTQVENYYLCNTTSTSGWVHKVLDLNVYGGQTITLSFRVVTNGSVVSNLFIDDVTFQSSPTAASSAPAPVVLPSDMRKK